jgi:hypothetical protein
MGEGQGRWHRLGLRPLPYANARNDVSTRKAFYAIADLDLGVSKIMSEQRMRTDDDFEVFKGRPDTSPIRLGAVRGCERATELMYRMYARLPGDYFVRQARTKEITASVEAKVDRGENVVHPNFDIFSGWPDEYAVWVETVEGLAAARDRMAQIAAAKPGRYFVFSRSDHSILAYAEREACDSSATQSESSSTAA